MTLKEIKDLIGGIAYQLKNTGFPQKVFQTALQGREELLRQLFDSFKEEHPELYQAITQEFSGMSLEGDDKRSCNEQEEVFVAYPEIDQFGHTMHEEFVPFDGKEIFALFFLAGRNDEAKLFPARENYAVKKLEEDGYNMLGGMLDVMLYPTEANLLCRFLAFYGQFDRETAKNSE